MDESELPMDAFTLLTAFKQFRPLFEEGLDQFASYDDLPKDVAAINTFIQTMLEAMNKLEQSLIEYGVEGLIEN